MRRLSLIIVGASILAKAAGCSSGNSDRFSNPQPANKDLSPKQETELEEVPQEEIQAPPEKAEAVEEVAAEPVSPVTSPSPSPSPSPTPAVGVNDARSPLFRLQNIESGFLFTTRFTGERDSAIALGYRDVTPAIPTCVYTTSAPARTPLVRMYNTEVGNHFYSTRIAEVLSKLAMRPSVEDPLNDTMLWVLEHAGDPEGFLFPEVGPETKPLFRMFNQQANSYLITSDLTERADLLKLKDTQENLIWKDDGILGYAKACP
jgi:hypothetical protein